jgi:hypothetical protein
MLPGGNDTNPALSGGPSVDKLISDAITPPTVAFDALHLGSRSPWEICYTGSAEPVDRLTNPNEIASALFGDFTNDDPEVFARLRAQRQSVLDATKDNIAHLRSRISSSDRHRLDEYLGRIQQIEQRINSTIAVGEQCSPITDFSLDKSPLREWAPQVDFFHPYYDPDIASPPIIDCVVEALACDRTRVATLTYGNSEIYHWLTDMNGDTVEALATGDWHQDTVHAYWGSQAGDPLLEDHLRRAARWEHSQLAYLLHKLKSKQEGEGTLLDNCMIAYGSAIADGNRHSHHDLPIVLAGRGGGQLDSGRLLTYPKNTPLNNLFTSMCHMAGAEVEGLGDATGPLPL